MAKRNPKQEILHPGGMTIVSTPTMEYIAKAVFENLQKRINKKRITYCGVNYSGPQNEFSRKEVLPEILGNVRGTHVYLFYDFNGEDQMRDWAIALLTISAIENAQAERITLVIPTFPGQRQDRKDRSRVPITAKVVIDTLTNFETVQHAITLDMHAEQLEGFFPRAPDHLPGHVVFGSWIEDTFKDRMDDVVVVGPDAGSVKRNERLSERVNALLAFLAKKRLGPGRVEMKAIYGDDVKGKICIINDDILDTCGTMARSAEVLFKAGAAEVYLTGSHAVFGDAAYKTLKKTGCQVVVTDSLRTKRRKWLTVLPLAPYLAEVIFQNNIEGGSVSHLIENGLPKAD